MFLFFFFNDTATTEIYTLSLHDALPISRVQSDAEVLADFRRRAGSVFHACGTCAMGSDPRTSVVDPRLRVRGVRDRKSTRLNSSHSQISYAVFCLKKKKNNIVRCRPILA